MLSTGSRLSTAGRQNKIHVEKYAPLICRFFQTDFFLGSTADLTRVSVPLQLRVLGMFMLTLNALEVILNFFTLNCELDVYE